MADVQAIDALLVKVHDRLAKAMRIPAMPWPDPAAHGHEATGRAIHASYCAVRFKLMDAIAELTAARCAITAALTDGVPASFPVPEGWKLVPMEPTTEMAAEGQHWVAEGWDWPKAVYRAMVKVAPTYGVTGTVETQGEKR